VPDPIPDLIGTGVQTLVENARRLGLQWTLRLATVSVVTSPTELTAVYDSDTEPIGMTSLVGMVSPGSRVMVMQVPPAGNFIIGSPVGSVARQLIFADIAAASGSLALSTTDTLVPGCTFTAQTNGDFEYEATGVFDFDETTAGNAVCLGSLYINGAIHPVGSLATFEVLVVQDRATVTQQWRGTGTNGDVFELRARKSAAVGVINAVQTHTTLKLNIYQ